jgi:hypothetical protein
VSRETVIQRAAALHPKGLGTSEIAAELQVSRSTVQRAKASRPALFDTHEPGSLEHRRQILLGALDHGSLAEQLRAVELLEKLNAGTGQHGNGSGKVTVHLHGPTYCPACGEHLDPAEAGVVQEENRDD